MRHTYSITLVDDGEVGGTDIEATNLQEAWENALKWAEEGDWPDEGCVVRLQVERLDDQGKVVEEREEEVEVNVPDEGMHFDQNGIPIHRDVRQNPIDGLWYTNVWSGSPHCVFNVRRYGYRTRAKAEDGNLSDFNAASYNEPTEEVIGAEGFELVDNPGMAEDLVAQRRIIGFYRRDGNYYALLGDGALRRIYEAAGQEVN